MCDNKFRKIKDYNIEKSKQKYDKRKIKKINR